MILFFLLIFSQSVEYTIAAVKVNKLVNIMSSDANLLVVGPEMSGHCFLQSNNPIPLRGRTCPWNTFAIWNVSKLAVTGFPMIGDGVQGNRRIGGVEVITAKVLLNH